MLSASTAIVLTSGSASAWVRIVDLTYHSPGNTTRNRFDLFTGNGGVRAGAPTIIDLHGGGYTTGDKGLDQQLCGMLADMGYNVCSMNYTLAVPGVSSSFPQTFRDVRAMIAWVRTTGVTDWGLSPTIVVIGQSAGATIGLAAAYAPTPPEFVPPIPAPPGDYRVDAVVGMFGRYDLVWDAQTYGSPLSVMNYLGMPITAVGGVSRYAAAAARTYVGACSPPSKLIVGDLDAVVPPGNTYRLAAALNASGVLTIQQIVAGAGHGTGPLASPSYLAQSIAADLPALLAASSPQCGLVPPPNDDCAQATPILAGQLLQGTSTGATTDGSSPCGNGDTRDVWYRFVAPATARYVIDTFETTGISDTTLTLFSDCPPAGSVLACSDNAGDSLLSSVSRIFVAGESALLRVAGNNGATGIVRVQVDGGTSAHPPPINDTCDRASEAMLGINLGTTIGATEDSIGGVGPNGPCCQDDDLAVWFRFDAPQAALYRFDTFGSLMLPNTTLAVLGGCDGPVLGCNDDASPGETASIVETALAGGQRAYVRVAAPGRSEGSFVLSITLLAPVSQGACCQNGVCTVTVDAQCGGTFLPAQGCEPSPCGSGGAGACCTGTTCSIVTTQGACPGTYRGPSSPCGSPANPIACCAANFNRVGGVSIQDIFDFLSAYFPGAPDADINGSGGVTVQDAFDFLALYFRGC